MKRLALLGVLALSACTNADSPGLLAPDGPRFNQAAVAPVVNSLDDVVDAEGCTDAHCSLREAITFAQPGAQVTFSVTGTITLTTPEVYPTTCACLRITKDLAISGPGATRLTVRGSGAGSVFAIHEPGGEVTVSISGLTVTGGIAPDGDNGVGGGIVNYATGTTTLRDVTVSGNSAGRGGGLYNAGTLTLERSTVSGNTGSFSPISLYRGEGGGVFNAGTLTLKHSTVSGNTGRRGGGIVNWLGSTLTLDGSTVSGNAALLSTGGGVFNFYTVVIRNSTVSGNTAAAAGGGLYTVYLSTGPQTVVIQNSILADNTGGDCLSAGEVFPFTGAHNLVEAPGTCAFGAGAVTGVDPKLGPLADNGGATRTHALLAGSPAVDAIPAGSNGCGIGTDQRGAARPQGAGCDIGAFERTPLTVTSTIEAAGTLAKRTGGATVSGTLTCSEPTSVSLQVSVSQQQTKGRTTGTVSGSARLTVSCTGITAWTADVIPVSERFTAGAASVTASAPGVTPTSRTVQLN